MNNENYHADGIGETQIQPAGARGSALPCPRHASIDTAGCSNSATSNTHSISTVDALSGSSSMCGASFLSKLNKGDY